MSILRLVIYGAQDFPEEKHELTTVLDEPQTPEHPDVVFTSHQHKRKRKREEDTEDVNERSKRIFK